LGAQAAARGHEGRGRHGRVGAPQGAPAGPRGGQPQGGRVPAEAGRGPGPGGADPRRGGGRGRAPPRRGGSRQGRRPPPDPGPDPYVILPSEEEPAAPPPAPKPAVTKPGKGLDVGTVNLVAACQNAENEIELKLQRNVFLDVEITPYTKAMLTKLGVGYVIQGKRMYILGEPAFKLANVLNRRTRRPMKDGLISPKEQDALPIMKLLIGSILDE